MLGRELSLFDPETHRLSVDCHAAQHPGKPSPQAIQSVGVHLVALCLTLEHGMTVEQVRPVMGELSKGRFFEPIVAGTRAEPRSDDHHRAAGRADAGDVASLVRAWAQATWDAWSAHHGQLREWADTIVAQVPRLRGR